MELIGPLLALAISPYFEQYLLPHATLVVSPSVGRSGFGFCNKQVLRERVISPPLNPQSGLYPSTFSTWVA